jgi:hypothetical protein
MVMKFLDLSASDGTFYTQDLLTIVTKYVLDVLLCTTSRLSLLHSGVSHFHQQSLFRAGIILDSVYLTTPDLHQFIGVVILRRGI